VIQAKAVRKYGTELLAALNSMKLPKMPGFATGGAVRKRESDPGFSIPRFRLGGLVEAFTPQFPQAVPAFAGGGPVAAPSSGRPLSLTLPSGETIEGLTATEDAAESLIRYATNRRVRSAGRKPGWVR